MKRRLATFAAALLLLTASPMVASPAHADEATRAEALFREGKRLYGEGKLDEACAALSESDRLDPAVGTLGMLAACDERRGKLHSALLAYREVARRAEAASDERGAFAHKRAEALERRVPRITIEASDPATIVRVDGVVQDRVALREALRRDPGPITIEALHSDGTTFSHRATLAEGASLVLAIPAPARGSRRETDQGATSVPWAAIGAAGVGVVGLGVMTGFGISAASLDSDSLDLQTECEAGASSACSQGQAAREDAEVAAGVATVGFAVGVVGLATGTVLWILHGSDDEPPPVTTSGSSARFSVRF